MEILNMIIGIGALIIAIMAFRRTGGIQALQREMEAVSTKSEEATKTARQTAADALDRFEAFIRGSENKESTQELSSSKGSAENMK